MKKKQVKEPEPPRRYLQMEFYTRDLSSMERNVDLAAAAGYRINRIYTTYARARNALGDYGLDG